MTTTQTAIQPRVVVVGNRVREVVVDSKGFMETMEPTEKRVHKDFKAFLVHEANQEKTAFRDVTVNEASVAVQACKAHRPISVTSSMSLELQAHRLKI